jgi:hypothetical protein
MTTTTQEITMTTTTIVTNGDTAIAFANLSDAATFILDPIGQGWKILAHDTLIHTSAGTAIDAVLEGQCGDNE